MASQTADWDQAALQAGSFCLVGCDQHLRAQHGYDPIVTWTTLCPQSIRSALEIPVQQLQAANYACGHLLDLLPSRLTCFSQIACPWSLTGCSCWPGVLYELQASCRQGCLGGLGCCSCLCEVVRSSVEGMQGLVGVDVRIPRLGVGQVVCIHLLAPT